MGCPRWPLRMRAGSQGACVLCICSAHRQRSLQLSCSCLFLTVVVNHFTTTVKCALHCRCRALRQPSPGLTSWSNCACSLLHPGTCSCWSLNIAALYLRGVIILRLNALTSLTPFNSAKSLSQMQPFQALYFQFSVFTDVQSMLAT